MNNCKKIYSTLENIYPDAGTSLFYRDPFQLLVATILSAQCTDERVNKVTPGLFSRYKDPKDLAGAELADLEAAIRSTGFYKNKAASIKKTSAMIVDLFEGRVPDKMEDLLLLPGVARKTANIVLYHAYGRNEGIAVDTHVKRLSFRMGMTRNTDPVKIEKDLMLLFDPGKWGEVTNVLISHGRSVCKARKPECRKCPVSGLCPKAGVESHKRQQ